MADIRKKLEAFSLMRMLPPRAAQVGDVTREELRQAELGTWTAACGRKDDVGAALEPVTSTPEDPRLMEDFDEVLPQEGRQKADQGEKVIELSFKAG